jgi:hypothetical protein
MDNHQTFPSIPISTSPSTPPGFLYQEHLNSFNSTTTPEDHDDSDMDDDIFYEYIVFMIPCFLFILISLQRMISLNRQPLPEGIIIKQVSYNIKRFLSIYLAVVYTFQLFLVSTLTPDVYWVTEHRYGAAAYLLGIVAWILSHQLLGKEVERGIYQRFYSHRMFWILQFIVVIIKMSQPFEVNSFYFISLIRIATLCSSNNKHIETHWQLLSHSICFSKAI